MVRGGVLGDSRLDPRLLVRGHLTLHFFDNERKARLGIGFVGRRWRSSTFAASTGSASAARTGHSAPESDVHRVSSRRRFRQGRTGDGGLRACCFQSQGVVVGRVRARAAKRMTLRVTHGPARRCRAGGCSHQFGEFNRPLYPFRCS